MNLKKKFILTYNLFILFIWYTKIPPKIDFKTTIYIKFKFYCLLFIVFLFVCLEFNLLAVNLVLINNKAILH